MVIALLIAATACSSSMSLDGGGGWQGSSTVGGAGGSSSTLLPSNNPVSAVEIAVGDSHTCALTPDGIVRCWGDGSYGQLGDGQTGKGYARAYTAPVQGLPAVKAVRAGGNTTCALAKDGSVWCWGDGTFGQLGDEVAQDGHMSPTPVLVQRIANVVDLSVNGQNACAVTEDTSVECWGLNSTDEWLGFPSSDCGPFTVQDSTGSASLVRYPCETTAKAVLTSEAKSVRAGGEHNCTTTLDGAAMCWGADNFGQLGDGVFGVGAHRSAPQKVNGIDSVQALALGSSHTCAITGSAGEIHCWGDNSFGQLGTGSKSVDSFSATPLLAATLVGAVDISSSGRVTCAVLANTTVRCWGYTSTVLPNGTNAQSIVLAPTEVPGISGARSVRTGNAHACVVGTNGNVSCWGRNDHGQLGNGVLSSGDYTMDPVQ